MNIDRNEMAYNCGIIGQKVIVVPDGSEEEIANINNIIFAQQKGTGAGGVVCHDRAVLEKLMLENQ